MTLKSKAYIKLSLSPGVHGSRTVTADTQRTIMFLWHFDSIGPGADWGTPADMGAEGLIPQNIYDNQISQTSAPIWKGSYGKGWRCLFLWSPVLEQGQ